MSTVDCLNVLRGGSVEEAEYENGVEIQGSYRKNVGSG